MWYLNAVKVQCADLARTLAHLVFLRAARDTRRVEVDKENAHAAMARGWIGRSQNKAKIGNRCVVNPQLAASDDVPICGLSRSGADIGEVGAGLRLGQAIGDPRFRGEDVRQMLRAPALGPVARWQGANQLHNP